MRTAPAAARTEGRSPSAGPQLHVHTLDLAFPEALVAKPQGSPKPAARRLAPASPGAARSPGSATYRAVPKSPHSVAAAAAARQHGLCQTEPALLEALAWPASGAAGTQTDAFARACAPPSELALKRGVDAATSIEPGDLFDFEREVAPVLEQLAGRALEAAQPEAEDELRLQAVRQRRRAAEEARYRELVEVQRMEGEERRRAEARLLAQRAAEERAQRAQALQAKLDALRVARAVTQGAMSAAEAALQRPNTAGSTLSFGRAAEREVVGYLEAAGVAQLEAQRLLTPSARSAAGSRALSRAASQLNDPAGRPTSAAAVAATPTPRPATAASTAEAGGAAAQPPPASADTLPPRSATALAGEMVHNALQQAAAEVAAAAQAAAGEAAPTAYAEATFAEPGAGSPAFRPTTAVTRQLVGEAMEAMADQAAAALLGAAGGGEAAEGEAMREQQGAADIVGSQVLAQQDAAAEQAPQLACPVPCGTALEHAHTDPAPEVPGMGGS